MEDDGPIAGSLFPSEPSEGWTSPPECPQTGTDTYCDDCYAQSAEPWSLDRDEDGDRFGEALAIGDFNGDGYPDLAVGAPGEVVGTNADAGAVYVYLGTERGFEPWVRLHYDNGSETGPADYLFGAHLAAGDVDEDGLDDLAVGFGSNDQTQLVKIYRGYSYGLFSGGGSFSLSNVDPDNYAVSYSEFGTAMTFGDFDDDGHLDLVVGAPNQYVGVDSKTTGAVYVVYGDGSTIDGSSSTRLIPSSLSSVSSGMRFGEVIAVADVTGSGAHDVAVGVSSEEGVYLYENGSSPVDVLTYSTHAGLGASLVAGDYDVSGVAALFAGGTGTTTVSGFESIDPTGPSYTTWDLDDALDGAVVAHGALESSSDGQLLAQRSDTGTFANNPVVSVADLVVSPVGYSFHLGESVSRESDDAFGRRVLVADVDGDARRDVIVGAPSQAGSGAGRVYVFSVDDLSEWADTSHWQAVWFNDDPEPVQVVTQETTPGDCDLCWVFDSPDGTDCGTTEAEVCYERACFTRTGCGDGYREPAPGSMTFPREGCDDGNLLNGDACSDTCEATLFAVSSEAGESASPGWRAPSLAEDANGELLFVYWVDAGATRDLKARRYSPAGVPGEEDASPIELATDLGLGWDLEPTVAGRSDGGWMVAWTDPRADGDGAGIATRRVHADGTLGPLEVVNAERRGAQRDPWAFAFDGGYGFLWVDESGLDGSLGSSIIKLRVFANDGSISVDETALSPEDGRSREPTAMVGDGAFFAWTEEAEDESEGSYVMGRALIGPALGEPGELGGPFASQPTISYVNSSDALVMWVSRDPSADFLGDIHAGFMDFGSDPPAGGSFPVVEQPMSPPHADLAPSLTIAGDGIIAYEDGGRRRGVSVVSFATLPTDEFNQVQGYLTGGLEGDVTLLTTSRGIWFAWSDAGAEGDPDAYRSFLAYLLPFD